MRQSIVGLLRHTADSLPSLRQRALEVAAQLQRGEGGAWLEAASSLFEEAVALSGDPIYVTGTYWAGRALAQVSPAEGHAQGGHEADTMSSSRSRVRRSHVSQDG